MLAKLIPQDGGSVIQLDQDITVVGRKPEICDLCLDRNSISKLHCLIVKTDGLLFVRDLGSTNGTKVNGQRVTRGALLPGDELAFAGIKFRVFLGPSKGAASASPGNGNSEATEMMRRAPVVALEQARTDDEASVDELHFPESDDALPLLAPVEESDSDVRLLDDESSVS